MAEDLNTTDVTSTNGDHFDTKYGSDMESSVNYFTENSKMKSNGIREVSTSAYFSRLEDKHGVTKDEIRRVHDAVDFENTAAAHVALSDLEIKIGESSAEQLADDTFRRGLSATVRLPTFGGTTEVTQYAETSNNIPFRGEGDEGPSTKTTYGRLSVKVNTKGRIHKEFHTEATNRLRRALGVEEVE